VAIAVVFMFSWSKAVVTNKLQNRVKKKGKDKIKAKCTRSAHVCKIGRYY
jgi:hypothetical protein